MLLQNIWTASATFMGYSRDAYHCELLDLLLDGRLAKLFLDSGSSKLFLDSELAGMWSWTHSAQLLGGGRLDRDGGVGSLSIILIIVILIQPGLDCPLTLAAWAFGDGGGWLLHTLESLICSPLRTVLPL